MIDWVVYPLVEWSYNKVSEQFWNCSVRKGIDSRFVNLGRALRTTANLYVRFSISHTHILTNSDLANIALTLLFGFTAVIFCFELLKEVLDPDCFQSVIKTD